MLALAITLQLLHLAYHQVTTLVDFFPFNGARFASRKEKIGEAISNFILMSVAPVGFIFRVPLLMEAGLVCYFTLLAGEGATWWLPYFFGASPQWREIYAKIQARTITVIPRRGPNPTPNLEHLILMALTLSTTLASFRAFRALPEGTFQHPWLGGIIGSAVFCTVVFQCCLVGRWKSIKG